MSSNISLKTALNIKSEPIKSETISAPDDYLTGVIQKIQLLFERQQFCDVTLVADDETQYKVEAHKVVLSAASEYFLGMFGGGLREASAKEVPLKVDSHTLKVVINFIYTASIELTSDSVEDIIKTAQVFQLSSLEVMCSDFIAKQLDTSNCIGITLFAEHHNFTKLYETAEAFVCKNFMKLRDDEEFYLLNVDQLSKIISSDELCLPSEEEVFNSLMSWVKYDGKREKFIAKLLHHVRFPLLLPEFIASDVERACKSIECERIICKAFKWHLLPKLRLGLFPEEQTKLRNFKDMIIAVSGWDNTEGILNVGLYYSGLKEWIYREWPGPLEKRSNFGNTTLNGKLIIAGGKLPSGEVTNRVDCLDLKTIKWTELPPLATARCLCGMAVLNGKVYVLGGENRTGALSSVEKWDPMTKQWQYVSPMRETNSNPRVAVRFKSLCVSKKRNGFGHSGTYSHNIYDPCTDTWTYDWLNTSGELLGMGTVCVLSTDYFIAVSRNNITRYNLAIKSSANIPTNAIKLECIDCTVIGDRIIVYGRNDFQEYHVFQNEWKTLPRLTNNHGKVVIISA